MLVSSSWFSFNAVVIQLVGKMCVRLAVVVQLVGKKCVGDLSDPFGKVSILTSVAAHSAVECEVS